MAAVEGVTHVSKIMAVQPAEFVEEMEKDNLQSVMNKCADVHPGCTLGLLVDKVRLYLMQQDKKACDQYRATGSTAGCFR